MTSHSYTPEYIQQSISKIYDDYKDSIEVEIRGNDLTNVKGFEVYDFEPNFYDIRPDFLSQIDFSRFPMMKTLKLTSVCYECTNMPFGPSATPFNFNCLLVRETGIEKLIVDFASLSSVYALPVSLSVVEILLNSTNIKKLLHFKNLTRFSIGPSSYEDSSQFFHKSQLLRFIEKNPQLNFLEVDDMFLTDQNDEEEDFEIATVAEIQPLLPQATIVFPLIKIL